MLFRPALPLVLRWQAVLNGLEIVRAASPCIVLFGGKEISEKRDFPQKISTACPQIKKGGKSRHLPTNGRQDLPVQIHTHSRSCIHLAIQCCENLLLSIGYEFFCTLSFWGEFLSFGKQEGGYCPLVFFAGLVISS